MKKTSTKQKKILISGYYGFDNFGDEAILGILTKKLKELGAKARVLSISPNKTANLYEVDTTPSFCPMLMLRRIAECDILVSGGGSLLQDVTSIKSLIYYLLVINVALFFRKKVIIFAQGIGPINSKFGAFLTKKTLQKCHLVTVRDRKSRMLLKKWDIDVELVCDPLFDLKMKETQQSNKVGVQLRSFKTLKDELLKKLAKQVCEEFSDKEIEIFSFQDKLDLAICKKFENYLREICPEIKTKIFNNQTSAQVLDRISKLEYMIAMRFHAALIALKYGIKTLGICYDVKVEKLAEDAQIPYVSMSAEENYKTEFKKLKALDCQKLKEFSDSNHFDWKPFEKIILG